MFTVFFLPRSLFCCALLGCFLARKFGKLKKLDCFAVDAGFFPYTSLTVTLLPLTSRFGCCRAGGGRKFILFLLKINTLHCLFLFVRLEWAQKIVRVTFIVPVFSSSWMGIIYRISTGCVEMKPRIVIPLGDGRWSRRLLLEEGIAVIVGYLSPLI